MSILYNKKTQVEFEQEDGFVLDGQSKICNWLYNRLLEACVDDYKNHNNEKNLLKGRNLRDYGTSLKDEYPFLKTVFSSVLKEPSSRLKKAYDKFFKGDNGYPKFRSWKKKWFSLVYDEPDKGWKLSSDGLEIEVSLGKFTDEATGNVQTRHIHGKLKEKISLGEGEIFKTFSIVKQQEKFYAVFAVERCSDMELLQKKEMSAYRKACNAAKKAGNPLPEKPEQEQKDTAIPEDCPWISLDPNHKNYFVAVDYQGNTFEFKKLKMIKHWDGVIDRLKSKRDKCRKAYRKRKTAGGNTYTVHSPRWNRINHALEQAYNARREQIKSALYSIAHLLYDRYDLVMIGDYTPTKGTAPFANMRRSMLNQEEIGKFRRTLKWVAQKRGKYYLMVDECNTTKECCVCGHSEKKGPAIRQFTCEKCGTTLMRDNNSAVNIARKAGYLLDMNTCKEKLKTFHYYGEAGYGIKAVWETA